MIMMMMRMMMIVVMMMMMMMMMMRLNLPRVAHSATRLVLIAFSIPDLRCFSHGQKRRALGSRLVFIEALHNVKSNNVTINSSFNSMTPPGRVTLPSPSSHPSAT